MGDVVVYLVAPAPPNFPTRHPEHESATILFSCSRSVGDDSEYLWRFSDILKGTDKDKWFETLYMRLAYQWYKVYDTINPFGDSRQVIYQATWTLDLKHDVLLHANEYGTRNIRLGLLRQQCITLNDFQLLPPLSTLSEQKIDSVSPSWEPEFEVSARTYTFTHRLLRDFNYQWRHILRRAWNVTTSRAFARAIVRVSTQNFEIREVTKARGSGGRGWHVWVTALPEWEPFTTDFVRIGHAVVVICQNIEEGLSMAQKHAESHATNTSEDTSVQESRTGTADYLILSVKQIMLCRLGPSSRLEHTRPERLLNGIDPPSELALRYLLWATSAPLFPIRLHLLPVEVQDLILRFLSAGPVEPARVGCLLGLGSEFTWMDGPASIALEETSTIRSPCNPIASQILFGNQESGIVYKGRTPSNFLETCLAKLNSDPRSIAGGSPIPQEKVRS